MGDKSATAAKSATITLDEPLERGEDKIETLTLRRPDAGALRGISLAELLKMDTGAIVTLLPRISAPPLIASEAEQLAPADLLAIGVEIASFFMTRAELARFPTT